MTEEGMRYDNTSNDWSAVDREYDLTRQINHEKIFFDSFTFHFEKVIRPKLDRVEHISFLHCIHHLFEKIYEQSVVSWLLRETRTQQIIVIRIYTDLFCILRESDVFDINEKLFRTRISDEWIGWRLLYYVRASTLVWLCVEKCSIISSKSLGYEVSQRNSWLVVFSNWINRRHLLTILLDSITWSRCSSKLTSAETYAI